MDTNTNGQDPDILGYVPGANQNGDYTLLEEGDYEAFLRDIQLVDKTPEKIAADALRYPDKTPESQQRRWIFEITEEEFAGVALSDWTSLSWHEKSTGRAHAEALYPHKLQPDEEVRKSLMIGRPCRIQVIVYQKNESSQPRNYIKLVLPPSRKQKAAMEKAEGSPQARFTAAWEARKAEGWTQAELKAKYAERYDTGFDNLHEAEQPQACKYIEELGAPPEVDFLGNQEAEPQAATAGKK